MPRRGGPSSPAGGLRFGGERRLALARRGSGSYVQKPVNPVVETTKAIIGFGPVEEVGKHPDGAA